MSDVKNLCQEVTDSSASQSRGWWKRPGAAYGSFRRGYGHASWYDNRFGVMLTADQRKILSAYTYSGRGRALMRRASGKTFLAAYVAACELVDARDAGESVSVLYRTPFRNGEEFFHRYLREFLGRTQYHELKSNVMMDRHELVGADRLCVVLFDDCWGLPDRVTTNRNVVSELHVATVPDDVLRLDGPGPNPHVRMELNPDAGAVTLPRLRAILAGLGAGGAGGGSSGAASGGGVSSAFAPPPGWGAYTFMFMGGGGGGGSASSVASPPPTPPAGGSAAHAKALALENGVVISAGGPQRPPESPTESPTESPPEDDDVAPDFVVR